MRLLLAPDSFKESVSASAIADAMAAGAKRADLSIIYDACPLGDGGEGTMDAMLTAIGGSRHRTAARDPLGNTIEAEFAIFLDGTTAIVELAQASGLHLVPTSRRDPSRTSTFGTGQVMLAAMRLGCRRIILCIGGSATVDGGTGIAQALGWRFFDNGGREITERITGSHFSSIARVEPPLIALPHIRVACDVDNPLCGPNGAAAVYGPQKGATPDQIRLLDDGLAHLASVLDRDPDFPGAGSAGGAGFGLAAFCEAKLEPGIDLVLDLVNFRDRCKRADLVLTGEGRLDSQSLRGKTCIGVARTAQALNVPTIAIVGSTGPGAQDCTNPAKGGLLHSFISLADRFGLDRALQEPAALIMEVTARLLQNHPPQRR